MKKASLMAVAAKNRSFLSSLIREGFQWKPITFKICAARRTLHEYFANTRIYGNIVYIVRKAILAYVLNVEMLFL